MKRTVRKRRESGQSLVEFALVLPLLLLILCGKIDFGWIYYNRITLSNAAREGARYAVIHYAPGSNWKTDAERQMMEGMVGVVGATAIVSDPDNQQITASVTAEPRLLTGLSAVFIGRQTVPMQAQCTMRLEN